MIATAFADCAKATKSTKWRKPVYEYGWCVKHDVDTERYGLCHACELGE